MVPGVGIEPTTLSSSGLRSTTELPRPNIYTRLLRIRAKTYYSVHYNKCLVIAYRLCAICQELGLVCHVFVKKDAASPMTYSAINENFFLN